METMATPLTAILVGCGGISRAWLDTITALPDVRLAALVDLNEAAARERAEQYALTEALTTADLDEALARVQPEVVFDCTVPEAHHAVTLKALAAGCHVMGEKPLADTLEHAREMVAAAQRAGRHYAVMQNRRYAPAIRRVRHILASGALGRITTVNSDFYIGAHFGGFRDRMRHVLLVDMAIHTFDMARFLMGADARGVYCHEWNPPGSWYDHDASAAAIFEMTQDIVYTYRGSWCAEGMNTTWECDWRIVGERGTLLWDGGDQLRGEVVAKTGGFFSEWAPLALPDFEEPGKAGGHGGAIREFLRCVRSGETPETTASDNIKSLAMVFGAVESAESGQRVAIAP